MHNSITKPDAKLVAARPVHQLNDTIVRVTADTIAAYKNGARLIAGGVGRVWAVRDGKAIIRFAVGDHEDTCVADVASLEVAS